MVRNKALVIGALGQDGSFICDILLENKFEVFGLVKPNTDENRYRKNVSYIKDDISNIKNIIKSIRPNHIYNFMGVTDVFDPWSKADEVYENNFMIPVRIIEAIKEIDTEIKFLQASSSLVFGLTKESPQNENTYRSPIYHYGMAKNFTDEIIKLYRDKFKLKLNSVILYPHESERRGDNFLSKKIINGAFDISLGKKKFLEVGDVEGFRDIGYAEDYMKACFIIMSQEEYQDYVIGSGKITKTIDFIKIVFNKINIDIDKSLIINKDLKRGVDLSHLVSDNSKICKLGWSPEKDVENIIDIMIDDYKKNL